MNFCLLVKPVFTVVPNIGFVLEGSNVTLHCSAEGVPKPDISWSFSGAQMPRHKQEGGNLKLMDVKNNAAYEGNYTCVGSSRAGSSSKSVKLVVDGK